MKYIITAIISYLFGTFNFAYFYSRAKGFDIRDRGSNNPGACNMKVNFGWAAGIITGLCDMLKAILAVKLCAFLFPDDGVIPFLAGAMAIVGHMFPFYMGFKGGKGYASYLGMIAALNFKLFLIVFGVTAIVTAISNYIAVGTYAALLIAPVYYFLYGDSKVCWLIVTAASLLVAIKHGQNIRRIINHEEIGFWDKPDKTEEQYN